MDCKTAQQLLDFARPQRCELEPEEIGALQGHLDRCSACHSLADGERQLDERLGSAMRRVEVPSGLRAQILDRLESERGDWYRQRFAQGARRLAAAAAVLLMLWFGWRWLMERSPPSIDPAQVADAASNEAAEDPRLRAEEALKRLGVDAPLSPQLNYNLLIVGPALAELPGYRGRQVPLLVFEGNGRRAWVYVVKTRSLPNDVPPHLGGATYKAELLPDEREPYRFLVIHDGDSLDWLRPPESPAT